jgi:hypothetical protein
MSQMRERLMVEVVSVIDDQLKKFQELQFLHEKRGRCLRGRSLLHMSLLNAIAGGCWIMTPIVVR